MKTIRHEEWNADCGTEIAVLSGKHPWVVSYVKQAHWWTTFSCWNLQNLFVAGQQCFRHTHSYRCGVEGSAAPIFNISTCGLHLGEWACILPLTRTRQLLIQQSLNPAWETFSSIPLDLSLSLHLFNDQSIPEVFSSRMVRKQYCTMGTLQYSTKLYKVLLQ